MNPSCPSINKSNTYIMEKVDNLQPSLFPSIVSYQRQNTNKILFEDILSPIVSSLLSTPSSKMLLLKGWKEYIDQSIQVGCYHKITNITN